MKQNTAFGKEMVPELMPDWLNRKKHENYY